MEGSKKKIVSFTDLRAWQAAHTLCLMIYGAVKLFPQKEQYILTSQICRACISVTSNIAEGFGRASKRDKEHFYIRATGSLYEIKSRLLLARDLRYVALKEFKSIAEQVNLAHKLLNGLIKVHKEKSNV